MVYCLNPSYNRPLNPDINKFCKSCGTAIAILRNHYKPVKLLSLDKLVNNDV